MKRCTDITLVLDKSGSMGGAQSQTIDMVNEYMVARRKDPEPSVVGLVQFSSLEMGDSGRGPLVHTFAGLKAQDAPPLSYLNYRINGMTAYWDALDQCIDEVGERLSVMAEADRPDRVMVVVVTDGLENHSRKYPSATPSLYEESKRRITEKVAHQRTNYKWEFVFMGAGMTQEQAEHAAATAGIFANNALGYAKSNSKMSGQALSSATRAYTGALGATGPQGPTGPGIFAIDEGTTELTSAVKTDTQSKLGGSAGISTVTGAQPPKRTRGRPRKS